MCVCVRERKERERERKRERERVCVFVNMCTNRFTLVQHLVFLLHSEREREIEREGVCEYVYKLIYTYTTFILSLAFCCSLPVALTSIFSRPRCALAFQFSSALVLPLPATHHQKPLMLSDLKFASHTSHRQDSNRTPGHTHTHGQKTQTQT